MKVVALVSGGKDSCYAMQRCVDFGHQIIALANLLPLEDTVDELDSFMFQTVGHQMVGAIAQCMGLPLFRRRIQGTARTQELRYRKTEGDEV
jgi:diphthine-ammonia ligase